MFGDAWGNSYTWFIILDINFCFTCVANQTYANLLHCFKILFLLLCIYGSLPLRIFYRDPNWSDISLTKYFKNYFVIYAIHVQNKFDLRFKVLLHVSGSTTYLLLFSLSLLLYESFISNDGIIIDSSFSLPKKCLFLVHSKCPPKYLLQTPKYLLYSYKLLKIYVFVLFYCYCCWCCLFNLKKCF